MVQIFIILQFFVAEGNAGPELDPDQRRKNESDKQMQIRPEADSHCLLRSNKTTEITLGELQIQIQWNPHQFPGSAISHGYGSRIHHKSWKRILDLSQVMDTDPGSIPSHGYGSRIKRKSRKGILNTSQVMETDAGTTTSHGYGSRI